MKIVYLTSGPRGSGKSQFVKKIASPGLKVISRDELLIELFGSTSLNPYEGGHYVAAKILFERIGEFLASQDACKIVLDCWNGFSSERISIIRKLRELGADRVICWQFQIPVDLCVSWFFAKPDSRGYSEDGIRRDYDLYYKMAADIESDGFDSVQEINPHQLLLFRLRG